MIRQIIFWVAVAFAFRTLAREMDKDLDRAEELMEEEDEDE